MQGAAQNQICHACSPISALGTSNNAVPASRSRLDQPQRYPFRGSEQYVGCNDQLLSSASITLSSPAFVDQIFSMRNPTEASRSCHCPVVLSVPVSRAIILKSRKAPCGGTFVSGKTNSSIKSFEYPCRIAAAVLLKISRHARSGQSCRTRRMRYALAPAVKLLIPPDSGPAVKRYL